MSSGKTSENPDRCEQERVRHVESRCSLTGSRMNYLINLII